MSVGLSVFNEFYRSVILLLMYICCYYCVSLDYKNVLLLYLLFGCNSSYIYHNVGLSVDNEFMEVLYQITTGWSVSPTTRRRVDVLNKQ